MSKTEPSGNQVRDGSIKRADLHIANPGESVIRRLIAGPGVTIDTSTGADSGTGDVTVSADPQVSIHMLSGRFDLFDNGATNNWSCWADSNFGPNLEDWDFQIGSGAVPTWNWQNNGLLLPQGTTLKKLLFKGRANNNDVDSIQIAAAVPEVDLTLGDAVDSNGEMLFNTIANTTQDLNFGLGNANDMKAFEVSLGDHVMTEDGDLQLAMKAVDNSITQNRQWRGTITLVYVLPRVGAI